MAGVPETRYARSGDVHVAYQFFGDGSIPLVGVPPIASNLDVQWEDPGFAHFAGRLGSFSRIVAFDKRGTGLSDRDVGIPTLEERVDDLRAVMDAVGFEKAFIAGISDGGSTAALFAAMHPERTLGLVLYGTAPSFVARPDLPTAPTDEVWEQISDAVVETWGTPATLTLPLLMQSKIGDEEFLRWFNQYERQSASPSAMRALMRMNALIDLRAVLPTISVPTLVCHRKADPAVGIDHGRYLASHIPNARLVELEGVDHIPWYGDADALADEMEEFITGVRPARGPPDSILATVLVFDVESGRTTDIERKVTAEFERFRGRRVAATGAGVVAVFDGPARAVGCAAALRSLGRVGIHTGVCEVMGDAPSGAPLAEAARLASEAQAGEVVVSQLVRDLVIPGSTLHFTGRGPVWVLEPEGATHAVESDGAGSAIEAGARWKERYEPLEMIGEGSQGQVYRAMDHQHDRVVALKVRAVGSPEERAALLSEARILLGLRPHAGVPLVRDDFFIDERYVIVMDWIDGTNLADILEQRGDPGLATGTVVAYLAQVAEALDHLHSHNPPIVHGDVKPANCVLTAEGRVVLVDFGISSWGGERRVGSGTRGYLAPEVAAGDLPTPAADIFGLAATTFALLDGVAPGAEGNIPSSVHPLAAAVRRGLAIDPTRRPASAGELVQRLRSRHDGDLPVGVVTFMLTDIEGSTAMWDTNPEAMAEALVRHEELIVDVVDNLRGRLIKSAGEGDATLSVFIRATDAVPAALELQRVLAAEPWPGGLAVRVRVALHTGEAQLRDGDYFGTTVNRAARLRGLAVGGQVMLSQATYQVVADQLPTGVSLRDLGRHQLKGLSRDEQVFELEHPDLVARHATGLARVMPVVPLPRALTRDEQAVFVGRDAELSALRASWSGAGAGRSSVAFVAGEPGIGKSSLVTQLVDGAHADGALVLAGRCDEGLAVPYKPFVEALRWHVEHAEDQDLVATLGKWPGELSRLLPELADRVPGLPAPLSSDPQTERWRLFESVASWLGASAVDRPLLLALEDMHWAAAPTLQLLRHVAGSDQLGRAFLLTTYRDTEVSDALAETIADLRRDGATSIALRGLDESAVAALVTAAAGHTLDDRGRRLARVVHDATGGVPLFVREVLAHLAETGAIYLENGRWTSDLVEDQLAVPEIARDVIRRRLSRLEPPVRAVLSTAAVVGLEVEFAVLEQCFTNGDALEGLERETGAGLVQQVGPGVYRFAHALIRQAVYDEITTPRRRLLHAEVGEAMEHEHALDLDPYLGVLAQHFTLSETEGAKALKYMLRAGDAALAQQAHDDAIGLFEGALDLIDPMDRVQRCDAFIGLAEARRRAGGAAYREAVFAAGELAEALGDGERLTRAALVITRPTADMTVDLPGIALFERALKLLVPTDSTLRARAMAALGLKLIKADTDITRRVQLSDDALAMARRLGDLRTLGDVLSGRNNTIWFPDSVAPERLANLSELGAIAEKLDDPYLAALAQAFAPSSHVQLGNGEAADASLEALEQIAGQLGQPLFVWVARVQRAMRALGTGRLAEAETLMIDALAAGEAAGDPDAIVWYGAQLFGLWWFRGEMEGIVETVQPLLDTDVNSAALAGLSIAYIALGREGEARDLMAPVLASGFADIPQDATWLSVVTAWAHVAAQLDDEAAARVLTELLLPFASQVDATAALDKGPVAFYLGLLATTLGDWDDAEKWFTAARDMCDRLRSIWGPRVRYGWARLLVQRGRANDAAQALVLADEGLELARSMAVPADIECGEALVRELSRVPLPRIGLGL